MIINLTVLIKFITIKFFAVIEVGLNVNDNQIKNEIK